jgi:hypothetical protein
MTAIENGHKEDSLSTPTAELTNGPFAAESEAKFLGDVTGAAQARSDTASVDKSGLALPEPRRVRDKVHVQFVSKQPCLICGRRPADPHHLRFAQRRALGRKVSDEFTVPLCRGHHRELHRGGNEAEWWKKSGVDPLAVASMLWAQTRPLPAAMQAASAHETERPTEAKPNQTLVPQSAKRRANRKTKPILAAGSP